MKDSENARKIGNRKLKIIESNTSEIQKLKKCLVNYQFINGHTDDEYIIRNKYNQKEYRNIARINFAQLYADYDE